MERNRNPNAVPGWKGGFAQSNPAFAYPDPDLTSLAIAGNMNNIHNLQRQQDVYWPEFSWETVLGEPDSRCFQRFAHDISRLGYDNTGRVWSIICPQQGACATDIGCMNVEVTVTGNRGWVDEDTRELAADMGVDGTIWFSPSSHQNWFVQKAWDLFRDARLPFPSHKGTAIEVTTHKVGSPGQPIFPVRKGQSTNFEAPDFAKHPEAWTVGNLEVQIGPIKKTGFEAVDTFNQKILDIFNIAAGNMLQNTNILTWNVWFTAPELVDRLEWRTHAERWRRSIDADHGGPDTESSPARYADGTVFEPPKDLEDELKDILGIIESLL